MYNPHVLIVNDELSLRNFFSFNLKARGYEVTDTTGTPEVFNLIRSEHPDLVILDLMVQGIDGFELCHKICNNTDSSIIAFNMRGGEADLMRCLEMGVDDYLGKPFGVDELMARVRAVLRHRNWLRTRETVRS
jgi:DNA-binding response OmpR family regulator